MSTITLELPDDIVARLTTPEGMARAQAAVLAAFAHDDTETLLTEEEWVLVDEALEQVEAGKMKPHQKAEIMSRAEELLKAAGIS
jgi:predicted transcriptional regulator